MAESSDVTEEPPETFIRAELSAGPVRPLMNTEASDLNNPVGPDDAFQARRNAFAGLRSVAGNGRHLVHGRPSKLEFQILV